MAKLIMVAAVAAMCAVATGAEKPVAQGRTMRPAMGNQQQRAGGSPQRAKTRSKGKEGVDESSMSRQEQSMLERIEDAETVSSLSRLIPSVRASRNVELRQAMVDALADKGRKGANELAYFIGDSNDDVAEAAFSAWTSALGECNASSRASAICAAAAIIQQTSMHGGGAMPQGQMPQGPISQGQMPHGQAPQGQMMPQGMPHQR